jgi:hypothetical protein
MNNIDPRIFEQLYDHDLDTPSALRKQDSMVRMADSERENCGRFGNETFAIDHNDGYLFGPNHQSTGPNYPMSLAASEFHDVQ